MKTIEELEAEISSLYKQEQEIAEKRKLLAHEMTNLIAKEQGYEIGKIVRDKFGEDWIIGEFQYLTKNFISFRGYKKLKDGNWGNKLHYIRM